MDAIIKKRAHPINIIEISAKYLFLLLIPLLRGFIHIFVDKGGFYSWLKGAWIDIIVLFFIIIASLLKWHCQSYMFDKDGFVLNKGFLLRQEIKIPSEAVSTLACKAPFWMRPFNAVHIYADTDAGSIKSTDFLITVYKQDAEFIMSYTDESAESSVNKHYKTKWYDVAILSIFVSNTLTGVIYLAALFNRTGNILGEDFQQKLITGIEGITKVLTFIPETAAIISIVLIAGWLIGFIRSFFTYINFTANRCDNELTLKYGIFSKRNYICNVNSINYLDFRQNITAKLLGLYIVFIQCVGYGKNDKEHSVLIPAANAKTTNHVLKELLPEFTKHTIILRPAKGSIIRFAGTPFWLSLITVGLTVLLYFLFPSWSRLILFIGIMIAIPFIWLLIVRIVDCNTSGVSNVSSFITIRYSRRYAFHTVVAPIDKINYVNMRSSIIQKFCGNCDLIFYTYNEMGNRHHVKNVTIKEAERFVSIFNKRV